MWEVFPWIAVACAAAAPTQAGRALLLMRIDPIGGGFTLLNMIGNRASAAVMGAVVAASILYLLRRGVLFDRALDATIFMLVPFLALMSLGAGLSALGAETWFLPHRRIRGVAWVLAVRLVVAYGWSVILFAVVFFSVWRRPKSSA